METEVRGCWAYLMETQQGVERIGHALVQSCSSQYCISHGNQNNAVDRFSGLA